MIESSGNDPYVITVGATNSKATPDRGDDVMTSYSAKGPSAIDHVVKPDIVAPGNRVVSLAAPAGLELTYPQNQVPLSYYQTDGSVGLSGDYFVLSGTSMSSAMVSGAAALMLQQEPSLTPDQIKARLMKTAYKGLPRVVTIVDNDATYTVEADIFTVGAGYLDVRGALLNKDKAPAVAKSPVAALDTTSGNAYFVIDTQTPWGAGSLLDPDAGRYFDDNVGELDCMGSRGVRVGRATERHLRYVGEFGDVGQLRDVG